MALHDQLPAVLTPADQREAQYWARKWTEAHQIRWRSSFANASSTQSGGQESEQAWLDRPDRSSTPTTRTSPTAKSALGRALRRRPVNCQPQAPGAATPTAGGIWTSWIPEFERLLSKV